jgi:S-adenosylmethionine:tRNA ribosyltransferase-isomerase
MLLLQKILNSDMKSKLSKYNFNLPQELIAQYPAEERDESRLMVVHKDSGKIEHKVFKDIIDYTNDGDMFVINNTKVFPARLYGNKEKTGAKIEVFLLRELNSKLRLWDVLVDPARKIRVGNKLYFEKQGESEELVAEVLDNTTSRGRTIRFMYDGTDEEFHATLRRMGHTPLPKYIGRQEELFDLDRYQTIFAKTDGAVAAPTAGLHFTKNLMKKMEIKGIDFAELTLHIGIGTFRTIDVEDLSKHKMDAEYFEIPQNSVNLINNAKEKGNKVFSVGTTCTRALESSITATGKLRASEGWTNLFIYPPYDFQIADALVTNFHLPKSSLLIMISAFADQELIMDAYNIAIQEKYKFFSYGDAMLVI